MEGILQFCLYLFPLDPYFILFLHELSSVFLHCFLQLEWITGRKNTCTDYTLTQSMAIEYVEYTQEIERHIYIDSILNMSLKCRLICVEGCDVCRHIYIHDILSSL